MKNKIILILIIIGMIFLAFNKSEKEYIITNKQKLEYSIENNTLQPFDLYFLKLENDKKNIIYSPLSLKYALSMLEQGAIGETQTQIQNILYNYKTNKYENTKNISFANALFIKDNFIVKEEYINNLITKYNAEVIKDSFKTPKFINSWVNNKTLGLINNPFNDISQEDLILINALAIDMEWNNKFLKENSNVISYKHENFSWFEPDTVVENKFKDIKETVSGMNIYASINNYDIVNILGENNIKATVKESLLKCIKENNISIKEIYFKENMTDDELIEAYLNEYIKEIDSNYKRIDASSDFSFYYDENVKAFSKDLKEYNNIQLEYISIMPNDNLKDFVDNITYKDINEIIDKIKPYNLINYKNNVVTKIKGFIPKFKYDYELDLINDLKQLGVKDVFDKDKANLKNITDSNLYINKASHKANIELTQDGIKAAAITFIGGKGAGQIFDYIYDIPVEEIDLTFDKPFMYIIRDKKTKEVWFIGTVYNPLEYSQDSTK